jgi:hypothetical protein
MTTSAAAARPFNTHADLAVIDLDRAHLCPCDAFNRADPSQCVLQRWRQFTSCRRMGAYLVHRSCGGPFPSIDDEEFVTRAVNCGQPAAVDGDAKGSIAFPSFPGPLLRSAPSSCAASRSTALPHRSLSPVRASSSRLSGKQRDHGQRPLHFQKQCIVDCWGAAAIGALRSKPPVNFRARANWSAKRRN